MKENYKRLATQESVLDFLYDVTEHSYCVASGSLRKWGKNAITEGDLSKHSFYQIMPLKLDDGFFDWYCQRRTNFQFHETVEMAVCYFIKYWLIWKSEGKPHWKTTESEDGQHDDLEENDYNAD